MTEVTLKELLEAGCHFGHKAERWNPRAKEYIYTEKDGIHIIDLAQTKAGLEKACAAAEAIASEGGEIMFVGTKRQAKSIIKEEASRVGAPYFSERWIGGFLTNWDEIHKNIQKINRLQEEQDTGGWKKFPKHEQVKLGRYLSKLKVIYNGVLSVKKLPKAVFVIDIKKEISVVREAIRMEIPIIAVCDTNVDSLAITYAIPANDDAVGSIRLLTSRIALAYESGWKKFAREAQEKAAEAADKNKPVPPEETAAKPVKVKEKPVIKAKTETKEPEKSVAAKTPVKRGRPKKTEGK